MSEPPARSRQLVVFDFDWSLVDQDTDRYLFEVLDPELRQLLNKRRSEMQWTDNVAECLEQLCQRGFTPKDIERAFSTLPLHPAMKRAIEDLHETNYQPESRIETIFLILSNSNSKFIEIVLGHQKIDFKKIFREIITNPAEWKAEQGGTGQFLKLNRRILASCPDQHQCQLGCSPNMCKGDELDAFLKRWGGRETFDRLVYIGDGGNDFCPIVRFSQKDMALVREGKELSHKIREERSGGTETASRLKCEIIDWEGAWQVEQVFQSRLRTL